MPPAERPRADRATAPVILYLSPHLDDAVLSAGGLIARQAAAGMRVVVATMVTADPPAAQRPSPLAARYRAAWGNPATPFADRCLEDAHAMEALAAEWRHLGLQDCTYRQSPSGEDLYVTMEALFSATPDPRDTAFRAAVADATEALVDALDPFAVYTCSTIGRHVDHVCVLRAVLPVLYRRGLPVRLWEDMPYATGIYPPENPDTAAAALARIGVKTAQPLLEPVDIAAKLRASRAYVSQIDDLFGSPEDMDRVVTAHALALGGAEPAERYWSITS